jgi:hypothetical protein
MFEPTSRYSPITTATLSVTDRDGTVRQVVYKRRRFVPQQDDAIPLATHTVAEGERLDHIAEQYVGDATQFWRICDGNNALHPDELTAEIGRVLTITTPF